MRHIYSQVCALIAEFGRRSLTLHDLERECASRSITLFEIPMRRLHGLSWTDEDGAFICLNKNLYPASKLLAGWHELFHVLLHVTQKRLLASRGEFWNRAREEAEAHAMAAIAVCPTLPADPEAGTRVEAFRYELFRRYGI
jgi:Zn-dependent peptidase ImmA (M78 family)